MSQGNFPTEKREIDIYNYIKSIWISVVNLNFDKIFQCEYFIKDKDMYIVIQICRCWVCLSWVQILRCISPSFSILLFQCPLPECKGKGAKVHSLTQKMEPLCLHNYLLHKAGLLPENKTSEESPREVNRIATINQVVKHIKEKLPSATSPMKSNFVRESNQFIDSLLNKKDIDKELKKYIRNRCERCDNELVSWTHKTKDSYLISFGRVKQIRMNIMICRKCNVLSYGELLSKGLIPIHNKVPSILWKTWWMDILSKFGSINNGVPGGRIAILLLRWTT